MRGRCWVMLGVCGLGLSSPLGWSSTADGQPLAPLAGDGEDRLSKNGPAEATPPGGPSSGEVRLRLGGTAGATPGTFGVEWVALPGGTFPMGSAEGDEDERPVHPVTLRPFQLMRTEATVAQYRACVRAGRCTDREITESFWDGVPKDEWRQYCNWRHADREEHPMNCIDWEQARQFCAAVGGRLPTEAEWEYEASGAEGRRYPWGVSLPNDGGLHRANYDGYDGEDGSDWARYRIDGWEQTAPVCTFPDGLSRHGLCDLAGNVWEWVADWFDPSYYGRSPAANPGGPVSGTARAFRGGQWSEAAGDLRAAHRGSSGPEGRCGLIGVRCAR